MKTQAKATARKSKGAGKKLKHVILSPMENGVMAEHHFMEPKPTGSMDRYMPPPEPERHALMSSDDMNKHMADTFPMGKSSPAPEPVSAKGGNAKGVGKPAADPAMDAEPDVDDDD